MKNSGLDMVVEGHVRALARETEADRASEALPRPGHQHNLAAQPEIHRAAY